MYHIIFYLIRETCFNYCLSRLNNNHMGFSHAIILLLIIQISIVAISSHMICTINKIYVKSPLTLSLPGKSSGRHAQSGVCSKNGLIASEFAIKDPVALARDDCHNDRTKVKVVELY